MENTPSKVSGKGQSKILVVPCTDSISSGKLPGSREGEQPELSITCHISNRGIDTLHNNGQISQYFERLWYNRGEPSGFRGQWHNTQL